MMPTPAAGDLQPLPPWLSARALTVLAVVVAVLLAVLAAWFLAYERVGMRKVAQGEVELHARLLAEQVDRNVDAAEVSLRAAAEALAAGGGKDPGALLAQSVRSLPYLRSITQLDPEGQVLASSTRANLPARPIGRAVDGRLRMGALLGGRDLADAHPPGSEPLRHLFVPLQLGEGSAVSPRVLAGLNADYFGNSFDLLLNGSDLHAALLQLDLRPVSASQDLALALGLPLAVPDALRAMLSRQNHGSLIGPGPLLDGESIWAFRATRKAPWLLVVAKPLAVVDGLWRALALRVGLAVLLAWLLLLTMVVLARRSLHAYREQRTARRVAQLRWQRELALNARLIDASSTPIYVKDPQGLVTQVNRAWRVLTGLHDLPLPADLPERVDPQAVDCRDDRLLAEGGASQFEARMDTPLGTRDVLISKAAFSDGEDAVAGLVCSLTDVSAYREVERRSREAQLAAQAANNAKTQFIANMSHELRTPLQSILGFSEIGRDRSADQPRVQALFQRVHAAGEAMQELVEGLLHLANPDALRGALKLQVQPVAAVLTAVAEDCRSQAEVKQQSIELQLSASADLPVCVDATELRRLLSKLVMNALEFAPPQSSVEICCERQPGDAVLVTVADRGPGIPDDELETIFQPFVRGSRTDDQAGGAGLGLAVARSIAGLFGARLWAANREGGGAVFSLCLPGGAAATPLEHGAP